MKARKHQPRHPERVLVPLIGERLTWEDSATENTMRKPVVELLYPENDSEEPTVPVSPVPWLLAR